MRQAAICNHLVLEMTLRLEIFPDDLDAIVDFYTNILGFAVTKDERAEPTAYVSLRRAIRDYLRITSRAPRCDRGVGAQAT